MLKTFRHWLKLQRLRCREWSLEAQTERAEELLEAHRTMYARCLQDLQAVRRRIVLLESPENLLTKVNNDG